MLLYDSNQSQKCSRSQVFMNAFCSGPEGIASIIRASSLETGSYPVEFVATQKTFNQYAPQLLHRPKIKSSESTWPTSVVSEPQFGELQQVSSIMVFPSFEDRRLGQSPPDTNQWLPVRCTSCGCSSSPQFAQRAEMNPDFRQLDPSFYCRPQLSVAMEHVYWPKSKDNLRPALIDIDDWIIDCPSRARFNKRPAK